MNDPSASLPAVRTPLQARSIATRDRILEAAAALLTEGGWDAFRVSGVSKRAGVSVGVIYQRFTDKDGLFAAVHETHLSVLESRVRTAFAAENWPDEMDSRTLVYGVVEALGRIFEELGKLNGVLVVNSSKVPGLAERGMDVMLLIRTLMISLISSRSRDMTCADTELGVEVCYRMAFATFIDFTTFSHHLPGAWNMELHRLVAEVARACVAYLFSPDIGAGP